MNMLKPDPAKFRAIGTPMRRKEDSRLIIGKGRFSDDFNIDGQVYMAVVRSPRPHARIVRIGTEAAKKMKGVLAVLTGADAAADGLQPLPHTPVPSTRYDMKLTAPGGGEVFAGPNVLLPQDKARYVGEAIAIVVGETKAQAMDGAEAVDEGHGRRSAVEELGLDAEDAEDERERRAGLTDRLDEDRRAARAVGAAAGVRGDELVVADGERRGGDRAAPGGPGDGGR